MKWGQLIPVCRVSCYTSLNSSVTARTLNAVFALCRTVKVRHKNWYMYLDSASGGELARHG